MRRTLADALASRIPIELGILPTDARVVQYINSAIETLLNEGHWWGTVQKYTVNVTKQLFTLPPQFATIEQVAVSQQPVNLRNSWYEFNGMGWGVVNNPTSDTADAGASQALFRGTFPTFQDIVSGNKVRLQCDVVDDVAVNVLVLGWDSLGNWVRTKVAGVWQDGETIALTQSPGTTSATTWSKITDIQKPVTKGQIWLYQWDGATATTIGNYQYWETAPNYSRYLLPSVPGVATQIDLLGKMTFVPVRNNTDYLIISNLEALRAACVGVKLRENYKYTESAVAIKLSVDLLNKELAHYKGDGEVPSIQVIGALTDGEAVCALV